MTPHTYFTLHFKNGAGCGSFLFNSCSFYYFLVFLDNLCEFRFLIKPLKSSTILVNLTYIGLGSARMTILAVTIKKTLYLFYRVMYFLSLCFPKNLWIKDKNNCCFITFLSTESWPSHTHFQHTLISKSFGRNTTLLLCASNHDHCLNPKIELFWWYDVKRTPFET